MIDHISCICDDGHTGDSVGLINITCLIYNSLIYFLRKLFWTDIGAQPVVESASLEGKDRAVIASTNLVSPSGLTIDFTEDLLLWCDEWRGLVETAALDGSDRQVLLENQVGEACVTRTHAQVHCIDKKLDYNTLILDRSACH